MSMKKTKAHEVVRKIKICGLPAKWTRVEIYSRKLKRNVRRDKLELLIGGGIGVVGEEFDGRRNKIRFIYDEGVYSDFDFGVGSYDIFWKMAVGAFKAYVQHIDDVARATVLADRSASSDAVGGTKSV